MSEYLLTHSMVQISSWEAKWFAASQQMRRISRNPKVHYHTHKRPPPVSILGQPNPVHIPTSHNLEIRPNIIHPSKPRSPQWSPSLRFPQQDPKHPIQNGILMLTQKLLCFLHLTQSKQNSGNRQILLLHPLLGLPLSISLEQRCVIILPSNTYDNINISIESSLNKGLKNNQFWTVDYLTTLLQLNMLYCVNWEERCVRRANRGGQMGGQRENMGKAGISATVQELLNKSHIIFLCLRSYSE